ncbi:MAG: hypothetical protein HQL31_05900 [Planctomycetes bacterium]|nr:hypothetical protein [Planctomycetota bacterium]
MRNAHDLSASRTIDPNFSVEHSTPSARGLSLFSRRGDGPQWLYAWGACESFLLNRLRHESFYICSNVDHPGRFRNFSPVLYARRIFSIRELSPKASLTIVYCGNIDLRLNNCVILHEEASSGPVRKTVPYGPPLQVGDNTIQIRTHAMGEPPTILILDGPLISDSSWEVSCDGQQWAPPTCFPFEGLTTFPHREEMPALFMDPKNIDEDLYDFGVEVLGRPLIHTKGSGEVELWSGESREEALNSVPMHREQALGAFTVKPGLNELPHELALRYLRVVAPSAAKLDAVSLRISAYPTSYRGAFAASDEVLTDIWMHAAYTLRLCMRELFIDGIKRDRLPWVGDLFLGGLCNYHSFHEPHIVRYSLISLYGEEPETVDLSGIADYSLYWVIALRDYVLYSGDVDFLRLVKTRLDRLLKAVEGKKDAFGLLPTASMTWVFIDWTDLIRDGYCSSLQMLYAMALDAAAELAHLTGSPEEAAHHGSHAQKTRATCRDLFWDPDRKAYADNWSHGQRGTQCRRHGSIFAILSGVATPEQIPQILSSTLLNPSAPAVGTPYMAAFEARALAQCGKIKEMLDYVRTTWGGMLKAGASTFWESWDSTASGAKHYEFYGRPFGKSLCHAWSSGPVFLLSGETFGLRPLEPGWKRFALTPPAFDLAWMCASIPTAHGSIEVTAEDGTTTVQVPAGTVLDVTDSAGQKLEFAGPSIAAFHKGGWSKS